MIAEVTERSDTGSTGDPPASATPTEAIGDALLRAELRARMFGVAAPVSVGRFEVLRKLGEGGMGVVYAARDPELDRSVALKLLHAGASDPTVLAKEARALARLSHPNVVSIHDVGNVAGHSYIAMELVEGETLRRWCAGSPGWSEIVGAFVQAGEGLAAAHAVGIVHRDFKPDNAIIGADRRVRVVDFGLARSASAGSPDGEAGAPSATVAGLTATGAIRGTPAYMAPEQALGLDVDARSDQFAFCVSLFEMLAGYRPFPGDDVRRLAAAAARGDIEPPPAGTKVPTRIWAALERGLSADPNARFETLSGLLAALRREPLDRSGRRSKYRLLTVGLFGVAGVGVSFAAILMAPTPAEQPAAVALPGDDLAAGEGPTEQAAIVGAPVQPTTEPLLPPPSCPGFRAAGLDPSMREKRTAYLRASIADMNDDASALPESLLWLAEFRLQAGERTSACGTLQRLTQLDASNEHTEAASCWHAALCVGSAVLCAAGYAADSHKGCRPTDACDVDPRDERATELVEGACADGASCCDLEIKFSMVEQMSAERRGDPDAARTAARTLERKLGLACDNGSAPLCALLATTISKRSQSPPDIERAQISSARACQLGHVASCPK